MKNLDDWLIKQAHIIWLASIVNIELGIIIPGFDFLSKSISYVALEAPIYAYTHRAADIVIGLSMVAVTHTVNTADRLGVGAG